MTSRLDGGDRPGRGSMPYHETCGASANRGALDISQRVRLKSAPPNKSGPGHSGRTRLKSTGRPARKDGRRKRKQTGVFP